MGFKDMVAADISAVFLNPDEFGETHNLNGTECTCVIYGDETAKRSAGLLDSKRTPDGLHGDFISVCVKASDLPNIPKMGTNFKVDGQTYKVDSCTEDMGMLTMTLGAYRMGVPLR